MPGFHEEIVEERDYRRHISFDMEFHRTIWRHQPNRQLERLLNVLCTPLFAYELVWRGGTGCLDFDWNLRQTQKILMVLEQGMASVPKEWFGTL